MSKIIFITATDTSVGKTVATYYLACQLRQEGLSVGVLKPVQCGGDDAAWLKQVLNLDDDISVINPFYLKEPLSPHLAFRRQGVRFSLPKIKSALKKLQAKYDVVLIEGAGGLLVPLHGQYSNAHLIKDLKAEAIIVSRLGLGTINHTLLTVRAAEAQGIKLKGILFSDSNPADKSIPKKTNAQEISQLTDVPVLGVIPYDKAFAQREFAQGNPASARLKALDKKCLWHPFTQMKDWLADDTQPLVIDQAQGVYLIDTTGKKYIDGVSSLWVNVHGHRHPVIDAAIKAQVDRLSHSTLLGLANTPAVELSKRLVDIAPKGLTKVFYSDNGSTAVEIALKMAYQYWQNKGQVKKTKLVHLKDSYHGDTLGGVSVGGIDLFHKVYRKLIFKTIALPMGIDFDKRVERLFKAQGDEIAAIVVEPLIQGAAGMLLWPYGSLKKLRALCTRYDIFLIVDEVATGFGRTGRMFACEHEGVRPDFLCLAKGITAGYLPLAATLTTQRVFDGFLFDYAQMKTFFHGHTYTGNPLACAAALANLEVFKKEATLKNLGPKIKFLAKRLEMFYNYPLVADIRQCGFMVGIELKGSLEQRIGARVCQRIRDYGVILRPLGNVVVLMPPLSISVEELDFLLNALGRAIEDESSRT